MALSLNANAPIFIPTPSTSYYYAPPHVPYGICPQASPSLQPYFYLLPGHTAPFEAAFRSRIVPRPDLYYNCYYYYCSPDQAAAYTVHSEHEQEHYVSHETPPMPLQHPFPRRKATLTPFPEEHPVDEGMQEMALNAIAAPVLYPKRAKGKRSLKSSFTGCNECSGGNSIRGRRRSSVPKVVKKWICAAQGRRVLCDSSTSKTSTAQFEFKKWENGAAAEGDFNGKTTVMIKNLPNKLSKKKLLDILDKHCVEENEKLLMTMKACSHEQLPKGEYETLAVEGDHGDGAALLSQFDFLYLPIDFKTKSHMGYAFVNFTTPIAAWRLYNFLHNYAWNSHGSRKVCEVTYARIQGLEALTKHFRGSVFACSSDDFLPVRFVPPRDGHCQTHPELIGVRRLPVPARTYMMAM